MLCLALHTRFIKKKKKKAVKLNNRLLIKEPNEKVNLVRKTFELRLRKHHRKSSVFLFFAHPHFPHAHKYVLEEE